MTLEDTKVYGKRLLKYVKEMFTKSMTEFTIDPRPIFERRKAITERIERLGNY